MKRYDIISVLVISAACLCSNSYAETNVWSKINIEPIRDIGSAKISVTFHRKTSNHKQLIVTAIKMAGCGPAHTVVPIELLHYGDHSAHLTAWLVMKDKGRELWLGTQLEPGVLKETLSIKIPGVLREIESTRSSYELVIDNPEIAVQSFTSGSPQFTFARTEELSVSVPTWLLVKKHEGWTRLIGDQAGLYKLNKQSSTPGARVLLFERSNLIEDWFNQALTKFFTGLALGVLIVILLVELANGMKFVLRIIIYAIVVILFLILYGIGGWQSFSWQHMMFSGATYVGLSTALLILGLLPARVFPRIREVYYKLKVKGLKVYQIYLGTPYLIQHRNM